VGLAGVPAIQAKLLHSLAAIYQVPWKGRQIAEFLGSLGTGIGIAYLARLLGRELFKLVPYLGQSLGAVYAATASGAVTFALGKAACYYLRAVRLGERIDATTLRAIYTHALTSGVAMLQSERREGLPD
jgi:uncharacterized protein (DUF697 family)